MKHKEIVASACAAFLIHLGLFFADFSFLGDSAPRLPGRAAIEVALVAAAPRVPAQASATPKEPVPKPKELPEPPRRLEAKKVKVQPPEEKPLPVQRPAAIPPEPAPPRDVELAPPEPVPTAEEIAAEQESGPTVAAAFQSRKFDRAPSEGPEPVSPPQRARPDYLVNDPPRYPRIARRRGYEGTTMLCAEVSPDGRCDSVEVQESSGYAVLDEAAVRAVKRWRFIPAQNGGVAVRSSVIIPVRFSLVD